MNKLIKPSFLALLTVFFTLFTVTQVAEAKRFGGGSSFGFSKSVAPKSFNTAPKAAPKATPTTGTRSATPARAGMMGMMGGLLAGGLLASLFMGDGFEGIQLMDILLMGLIAFGLLKFFSFYMRQKQGQTQSAYTSEYQQENYRQAEATDSSAYQRQATPAYNPSASESVFGSNLEGGIGQGVSDDARHLTEAPAWFNAEEFVEGAKGHFASLQKAWDDADLAEVESYCSPELFAALQQEMAGMQAGDNHTVIDTLDAELADMAIDGEYFIASIRFTGFIQEDVTQGAHAFNEIWHIRRLANDEGTWQVAGIQQNAEPL